MTCLLASTDHNWIHKPCTNKEGNWGESGDPQERPLTRFSCGYPTKSQLVWRTTISSSTQLSGPCRTSMKKLWQQLSVKKTSTQLTMSSTNSVCTRILNFQQYPALFFAKDPYQPMSMSNGSVHVYVRIPKLTKNTYQVTFLQEIVESPYMYADNHQQNDIMPGNLADCWFLSTCAAVAREPKLIYRVS